MNLAALVAVVTMFAPAHRPALDSLLSCVPLLAQLRGTSIDAVYAMDCVDALGAIVSEFAAWVTDAHVEAAKAALVAVEAACDPERARQIMTERAG